RSDSERLPNSRLRRRNFGAFLSCTTMGDLYPARRKPQMSAEVMRPPPKNTVAFVTPRVCLECRTSLVGGAEQRGNVSLRMCRAYDPVQPIGRSHVDATLKQQVNEARIAFPVNMFAVISIIVDRLLLGEINLEHGAEALHNRFYLMACEHVAQSCNDDIFRSTYFAE